DLHRKTIVAAYESLVAEDWVDNLPRKGFIISPNLPVVRPRSYNIGRIATYESNPKFEFEEPSGFSHRKSLSQKDEIIVDDGFPDISLIPTDAMLGEYRRALEYSTLKKMSARWDLEGSSDFRNALCKLLNQTRGIDIKVANLLTTRGAQMAIHLAASLIIKPGDKVLVSEPSYRFANMVFENLGADLIRVPLDSNGMDTERVEEELKKHNIKLLYVI